MEENTNQENPAEVCGNELVPVNNSLVPVEKEKPYIGEVSEPGIITTELPECIAGLVMQACCECGKPIGLFDPYTSFSNGLRAHEKCIYGKRRNK